MANLQPESQETSPSEKKLQSVTSLIERTLLNSEFPTEFRPNPGWIHSIKVIEDFAYEERLLELQRHFNHPFVMQGEEEEYEEGIRKHANESSARVDIESREILFRKSHLEKLPPDNILWSMTHEIGHLIPNETTQPYNRNDSDKLALAIKKSGIDCSPSDLKLWCRGLIEAIMFEGKQVFQPRNRVDIYGEFFDELYADVYRFYLLAHVYMAEKKMTFKQALSAVDKLISQDAYERRGYYAKALNYAQEVGFERLINAGVRSSLEDFIDAGAEELGDDHNKKALRTLYNSRRKFRFSFT